MAKGNSASPKEALERSRVDVVGMIRSGMPEREFVVGSAGTIVKSKRHNLAAEGKTGKTLAMSVVMALDILGAGGTVAVLDRENGADEFARRLEAVLDARGADDALREVVSERLRYYAWPSLSLDWRDDPSYVETFADVDLVIFDSTRSHLTPLGLKEDQSDDFAAFTNALIDPLTIAGVATLTLDNVGHAEKGRARGTSAKADLCDVAYVMHRVTPFSFDVAGRVELRCTHSRLGEVDGAWEMELGGGHYGSWRRMGARPAQARGDVLDAVLDVLVVAGGPLGSEKIGKAIRARPGNTLKIAAADLREGLSAWASDPASGVLANPSGKGYLAHVGTVRHDPHVATRPTRLDTTDGDTAQTSIETGDLPMSGDSDTARHGGHVGVRPPYGGDTTDTRSRNGDGAEAPESAVDDDDVARAERIKGRAG
jgi:hypothetical protein